jgi:signal peptidase I
MAQNDPDKIETEPGRGRAGRGLRIALIGRNPKITLARIIVLIVTCVVVFKFILLPIKVDGVSMLPTYKDKSVHFINRLAYVKHEPGRGDVVGIRIGGGPNVFYRTPGLMYMKRIIGLPGETVAFASGRVLINGSVLDEPYLKAPCDWNATPVTIGPDQYYFVGDNRSMPREYHVHGKAEKEKIVGKVLF